MQIPEVTVVKNSTDKQTHSDASPPVHSTALQQHLHAQHVTCFHFHSQQWVCICLASHKHDWCVCVCAWEGGREGSAVDEWIPAELSTLDVGCDWSHCHGPAAHWTLLQIKYSNVWMKSAFPTSFSLFLHFPQKRAKKLEGETIYIRHSNLMLEVCILSLQISVLILPSRFSVCMDFLLIFTFLWHFCWSSLALFSA